MAWFRRGLERLGIRGRREPDPSLLELRKTRDSAARRVNRLERLAARRYPDLFTAALDAALQSDDEGEHR